MGVIIERQGVLNTEQELIRLFRREGIDYIDGEDVIKEMTSNWPLPPRIMFSSFYIEPEVPTELFITDTTFRDGQQAFNAYGIEEAKELFKLIGDLDNGSGRIIKSEFFLYTDRDKAIVKAIRELNLEYPKVIGWGRARIEDVQLVKDAGLDEMIMLMSISDIHIKYKFNSTRDKIVSKYLAVAGYALKEGIKLRCSLEDVTRADIGFVISFVDKLLRLSEKYGVEITIKLPDTTGVGVPYPFVQLPYSIPKLVWVFRKVLGIPSDRLEFHGHGDYHMAVANAVSAWLYGAAINNATLLGIGERAGNVPIEALVIWYARIKGSFDGMNPGVIGKVANFFRRMGYDVPRYQPIVGSNAFSTAAGIHVQAQLKNPITYLSMDPQILGRNAEIIIGPYSGRSAVYYWLLSHGFKVNEDVVNEVYNRIVALYNNGLRRYLTDEEVMNIVNEVLKANEPSA